MLLYVIFIVLLGSRAQLLLLLPVSANICSHGCGLVPSPRGSRGGGEGPVRLHTGVRRNPRAAVSPAGHGPCGAAGGLCCLWHSRPGSGLPVAFTRARGSLQCRAPCCLWHTHGLGARCNAGLQLTVELPGPGPDPSAPSRDSRARPRRSRGLHLLIPSRGSTGSSGSTGSTGALLCARPETGLGGGRRRGSGAGCG